LIFDPTLYILEQHKAKLSFYTNIVFVPPKQKLIGRYE